ncbi:unnamed protein product [Arctogadus glacialis]
MKGSALLRHEGAEPIAHTLHKHVELFTITKRIHLEFCWCWERLVPGHYTKRPHLLFHLLLHPNNYHLPTPPRYPPPPPPKSFSSTLPPTSSSTNAPPPPPPPPPPLTATQFFLHPSIQFLHPYTHSLLHPIPPPNASTFPSSTSLQLFLHPREEE